MASDCMTLACKGMEACEMGTCTCSTSGGATQSPGGGLHGNRKHTLSYVLVAASYSFLVNLLDVL